MTSCLHCWLCTGCCPAERVLCSQLFLQREEAAKKHEEYEGEDEDPESGKDDPVVAGDDEDAVPGSQDDEDKLVQGDVYRLQSFNADIMHM